MAGDLVVCAIIVFIDMGQSVFEIMYDVEDRHWWYVGLRDIVFSAVSRFRSGNPDISLLDAGCGTGGILARCDDLRACGFDISAESLAFCRKRGCDRIAQASIRDIPFKNQCFDAVVSLDVLCCLDLEDNQGAFAEIYRVLKPGGVLILNLPAYQWLYSRHDRVVGSMHRYTAGELRRELEKVGFGISKLTYRNMFLFPAIAVKRLMDRGLPENPETEESDIKEVPKALNALLSSALLFENILLSNISFPFGLSVFCVARKE